MQTPALIVGCGHAPSGCGLAPMPGLLDRSEGCRIVRIQAGRVAFRDAVSTLDGSGSEPLVITDSPFAESLEAEILAADTERRWLRVGFCCGPQFLQSTGTLQGGALATMLDLSMAFASLAALPAEFGCATVQLNVHYLRPAFPGRFHAEAELDKLGKRALFSRAALRPADSAEPVATATAVFSVVGAGA